MEDAERSVVNLESREARLRAFGGGHKSQHEGVRFSINHAVDHDLIQSEVLARGSAKADQFVQVLERNGFLRVVRSVRANEHCLADGIRILHPGI